MNIATPDAPASLLERDASIAALTGLLSDVRASSRGRLVIVAGEAGVGKTALLRAFCETVRSPVRVLWAACEPLRTPRALGPLLDVAESVGGDFQELVTGVAKPHDVALALLRRLGGRLRSPRSAQDR